MKNILRLIKAVWSACCLLLLVVFIIDLINFNNKPESYPIGWEGGGWSYESSFNYTLSGYIGIFWLLIGMIPLILWKRKSSNCIIIIHFFISVVYVIYINL